MPITKVIRKGVTPAARAVPTSTTMTVLPMTLDRVGADLTTENEEPDRVPSLKDAFDQFKPKIAFAEEVQGADFKVDVAFRKLGDFSPENIQSHHEKLDKDGNAVRDARGNVVMEKNDLADLKNQIDVLYQIKTYWSRPAVQRAWGNEARRKEIVEALGQLRDEIEKAKGGAR